MGCRVLRDNDYEVFYCSTTMTAFGPVMYGDAEEFAKWLPQDPRHYSEERLAIKYAEFQVREKANERL